MAVQASKSISLTITANSGAIKLSANQIVRFTASGSGTLLTYITNQNRFITKLVNESPATINTAAARTQAVTLNNATSTVLYVHSDKIIYLDTITAGTMITLWNPGATEPEQYSVAETAANINTAAGNTFAITTQPTSHAPSGTRYINNLFIDTVNGEAVGTNPTITFTTKVKTGTGVVTTAGTGYTNPVVAITGGGGASATGTLTTQVVTATVVGAGSGGTPGLTTFTGTTGTGTKFTCTGTIGGGGTLSGALTVVIHGNYTSPITNIAVEPITGGSLTGGTVSVSLGLLAFTVTAAGTGYTSYPTFGVTDATGINGVITASMTVESPLVIVDGGSNINTVPTLTFSATSGTLATATATLDAGLQKVTGTTLTAAGAYAKGTDTYPTLVISGGSGAQIFYDSKKTSYEIIQVEETAATVQTAINAL
jgi:hypothetical protein